VDGSATAVTWLGAWNYSQANCGSRPQRIEGGCCKKTYSSGNGCCFGKCRFSGDRVSNNNARYKQKVYRRSLITLEILFDLI
jgi:hypothetical protein